MGINQDVLDRLISSALQARDKAYAPYSHFRVGAALLTKEGKIYQGCNIENASYGATNCAERTALFKAVSEGECAFAAIAIAGGLEGEEITEYAYPCGVCRQVMREFCDPDFQVVVAMSEKEYQVMPLSALLPYCFDGSAIR